MGTYVQLSDLYNKMVVSNVASPTQHHLEHQ